MLEKLPGDVVASSVLQETGVMLACSCIDHAQGDERLVVGVLGIFEIDAQLMIEAVGT